jgi:signal transduction histidine kinase
VAALQDERAQRRALLGHIAPIAFAIGIGLTALGGMISTDRRNQRLLEQQREFVARVTHELKTPIAGIQLMAENLEMGAFRGDEGRIKFAQQIMKESERLTRRVDEILRAAREPVDEDELPTDLGVMLVEIVDRWRPLFEQRGATLTLDAPEHLPARVKPAVIKDAVTNLIDNALKYGRDDRPLAVTVSMRAERRWVQVDVVDNGMGVPAKLRRVIFDRFRRVEGPGRGKSGGHGLGLSFVADAARAHGGKVECRDGVDGGARFVFRFRRKS